MTVFFLGNLLLIYQRKCQKLTLIINQLIPLISLLFTYLASILDCEYSIINCSEIMLRVSLKKSGKGNR